MGAQFKQDQKIICLHPLTTVRNLSELRSHRLEVEGWDLGTLHSMREVSYVPQHFMLHNTMSQCTLTLMPFSFVGLLVRCVGYLDSYLIFGCILSFLYSFEFFTSLDFSFQQNKLSSLKISNTCPHSHRQSS